MSDIVEAYSLKLWWRFRERNSLWAEYMHRKYWSQSADLCIYRSSRFSPTWRRVFRAGINCQKYLSWILGRGNLSFWGDIWVKDKPLLSLCSGVGIPDFAWVNDFWWDSEWNEEALWAKLEEQGVPWEVLEEILQIPFDPLEEDRARWFLTPHGNFTLSSAWEHARERGEEREVYTLIWNKSIIPTISVFLWRLLANRLPVDEKVQWRGVSLASKCRCCSSPKTESRLHLFVNGEAARGVWEFFAPWFPQAADFKWPGDNLEIRLRWWQDLSAGSSKPHISSIISCLILWYLWTERNGCVHRETKFRVENVCYRVKTYLYNLDIAGHLNPEQWRGCEPDMVLRGGRFDPGKRRGVEVVLWKPPEPPWLKLNSDGAFEMVSNKAGGGGLLRDGYGEVVEAFSAPLKAASSLEAEMWALWQGILMAKNHGRFLWLETDATILCSMLDKGKLGPADTRHIMASIRDTLKGVSWRISHIRREGNKAADCLASLGKESLELTRYMGRSIPVRVRALARMDQLGMPNFRFS